MDESGKGNRSPLVTIIVRCAPILVTSRDPAPISAQRVPNVGVRFPLPATNGNDRQHIRVGGRPICAGRGNRTPDYCLEGSRLTTKLCPRDAGDFSTIRKPLPVSKFSKRVLNVKLCYVYHFLHYRILPFTDYDN